MICPFCQKEMRQETDWYFKCNNHESGSEVTINSNPVTGYCAYYTTTPLYYESYALFIDPSTGKEIIRIVLNNSIYDFPGCSLQEFPERLAKIKKLMVFL